VVSGISRASSPSTTINQSSWLYRAVRSRKIPPGIPHFRSSESSHHGGEVCLYPPCSRGQVPSPFSLSLSLSLSFSLFLSCLSKARDGKRALIYGAVGAPATLKERFSVPASRAGTVPKRSRRRAEIVSSARASSAGSHQKLRRPCDA